MLWVVMPVLCQLAVIFGSSLGRTWARKNDPSSGDSRSDRACTGSRRPSLMADWLLTFIQPGACKLQQTMVAVLDADLGGAAACHGAIMDDEPNRLEAFTMARHDGQEGRGVLLQSRMAFRQS